MKVNANTLRIGHVIEHNNRLWVVTKTQTVQPGKGGAFLTAVLKDLRNGTKLDERWRTQESVERVSLEDREFQYLYPEDELHTFMDVETFDQITVAGSVIGDPVVFLQEGMKVNVRLFEGQAVSVELPGSVVLTVTETDPAVKGQTAAASYKPAMTDNGVRVMVPPHIDAGTRIVVNTQDGSYLERFKD